MPSARRLLVTGASGKTGAATVRLLLDRGLAVTALVRHEDAHSEALAELGAASYTSRISVTPTEEIFSALDDLVRAGKILHGGLSNFPAWRTAHAATIADRAGRAATLAGLQIEYNLLDRGAEREILPAAEAFGLGVMLYAPLGGGLLTGKYRNNEQGRLTGPAAIGQQENTPQKTATIDVLLKAATDLGVQPSRVAMAWLRHSARRWSTAVVPVIGPRTAAQLDDYLAALTLDLPAEHITALDEASSPTLDYPHTALQAYADPALGDMSAHFDRLRPVA